MLLIECPWCGPREELEFRYGGESEISRPGPAETVTNEAWGDYLFMRRNSKGLHRERWVHAFGCRQWFTVVRDATSHAVASVHALNDAAPLPAAPVIDPNP